MQKIKTALVATLVMLSIASCKQIKMTNEEAQTLVTQTLNLPQHFSKKVAGTGGFGDVSGDLEQAGYLTKSGSWLYGYSLSVTDMGKQFLVGTGQDAMYGTSTLTFKTLDIDFGEITGIAINKDQETATVRFSLKSTNVTPIGKMVEKNVDGPKNGELTYKKFDNGWQLMDNSKTGVDLVRQICWGRQN